MAVVETWKLTHLTCQQAIFQGLIPRCNGQTSSRWEDADDEIAPWRRMSESWMMKMKMSHMENWNRKWTMLSHRLMLIVPIS